ncbi:UNVERIFIED_CONTAM: hypothetical protein HDU68_012759 [Siphonaria sp. JEL0065]|nr:hypothetical protein HDU68_012759 [Siphonaria sp. JEL0065]
MDFSDVLVNQPVVLDNGSGFIKAGFAGDDSPKCFFNAAVGRPKHTRIMAGAVEGDTFIGSRAQELRGLLRIKYPMEHGIVTDWADMEKLWHHVYTEELKTLSEEHPVLLTEAPLNPRKNRETMAEIFFETFNVPAMYLSIQAVLSLYASGRTTGIVLDSGDGVTHTVPVYEGFALPHAIRRVDVAGRDITEALQLHLRKSGVNLWGSSAEKEVARVVKESCCYIAANPGREEKDSVGRFEEFVLPDGNIVKLGAERFRAPEILFNPDLIGSESPGIHQIVVDAINKADMDLRKSLFTNIVLSGGTTLMKGFPDRLLSEVKKLALKDVKIKISAPPERKYSTWIGGSILASLSTFKKMWLSADQYQEDPESKLATSKPQYQPTRDELIAENQSLFEEMNAMEIQHEQTLTAAVEALEKSARERRALERQVAELHASKDLLEVEKEQWKREREQLKTDIEELKKEHQSASAKAITALKDREQMKSQMIAIEGETAKLLDWLIEEGKVLEAEDAMDEEGNYNESVYEASNNGDVDEEGSLLDLKEKLEKSKSVMPHQLGKSKGKKLASSKLGQSSSMSTLYANALQTAGTITNTSGSHNRLVASNSSLSSTASADNLAAFKSTDSLTPAQLKGTRQRNSSVSHLRLSVCSLSKISEGKLPSSMSNLDGRILAQISQITGLLKAVLALQEETAKQLWTSKKKARILEAQVSGLGEWRDAVMKRVGESRVDMVPLDLTPQNPREKKDPMDATREAVKRLNNKTSQRMKIIRVKYPRLIIASVSGLVLLYQTVVWLGVPGVEEGVPASIANVLPVVHPIDDGGEWTKDVSPPLIPPEEQHQDSSFHSANPKCQFFLDAANSPNTLLLGPTPKKESQEYPNIPQNIFFLHYNDKFTNPRYLCSIESAARQNPLHSIHLYARNSQSVMKEIEPWLSRVGTSLSERFTVEELDWESGMMGTPLESWWTNGLYKDSSWVDQNLGNAFRMGLLYKNGGVYLDLDIVSLNPSSGLGRAISMQDKEWCNNAVFSMEKEDKFAWEMMKEFVDGFKGHIWARNGPRMVTRTYKKLCHQKPTPAEVCNTLNLMPTQRFFPIQYEQKTKLFEGFEDNCELMEQMSKESVGIHWWNKRVQTTTISTKTVLTVLMKAHCPAVFESFPESALGVDENVKLGAPDALKKEDSSLAYNKAKNEPKKEQLPKNNLFNLRISKPSATGITISLLFACGLLYICAYLYSFDAILRDQSPDASPPAIKTPDSEVFPHLAFGGISLEITTTNPACQHFLDRASSPGTYFLTPTSKIKAETPPISSIPKQIFFLHYNEALKQPRRLCSVESAARQNKDHVITIFVRNKDTFEEKIKDWRISARLEERLAVKELNWEEAMIDTPLYEWYTQKKWASSKWPDQNLGNAFRLGILWKYGGVYLDLDIISLNPLDGLGRSVARQDKKTTNNAFFSVEAGDLFIWEVMKEFVHGFRGNKWGHNGPAAVTRTIRKCKIPECKNMNLADPMRFFPFNYTSAVDQTYWDDSCEMMGRIADESVGMHYWDKRLQNIQDLRKTSIMRITMISHCPVLVQTFSHSELGMRSDDSMKK